MTSDKPQRAALATWPTPLEPVPRLARALGLGPGDLWVKRDDLTGLVAAVEEGDVRPRERTVFLHSGGLPGFFGHPDAVAAAESAVRTAGPR